MKKIVVASDSFKGSLSSLEICSLFESEFKSRKDVSLNCLPIADGGEGSLEAISKILDGEFKSVKVHDLYLRKRNTKVFISKGRGYIECASVVGLSLARKDNDPGIVTTYGLGEQIKYLIESGIKDIYVFLGGSASNDGGVGVASALGVKFFDKENKEFLPVGLTLKDISHIDTSYSKELLKDIHVHILSDVKNPFFGLEGAAYVFALQKGASKEELPILDEGLKHLSDLIRKELGIEVSNLAGSGAAGGLGGGLVAFLNGTISSGIETVLDLIDFDHQIIDADLVISGEGKLDRQTLGGKLIDGVAKRCMKLNKSLCLIVGVSELTLREIKQKYPCVSYLYETNPSHLPFEEIKIKAKEDYQKVLKNL